MPDYSTPYSIGPTIQRILQERRETSRQAMIDKLQEERVRADMDATQKRLGLEEQRVGFEGQQLELGRQREAREKTYTDAQIQQMRDVEFARRAENLPYNPNEVDVNALDPEFAGYLERAGRIRKTPAVEPPPVNTEVPVEGSELPALMMERSEGAPARRSYTGGPEWQKEQYQQSKYRDYLQQHPDIAKTNPELAQILGMIVGGFDVNIPSDVLGPPPSVASMSPEGNLGPAQRVPRGTQVVPRPYAPGAWLPNFTPVGIDRKTGEMIFSTNKAGKDGLPVIVRQPGFGTVERLGGPDQTPDTGIQTAIDKMRLARTAQQRAVVRSEIVAAASRRLSPEASNALSEITQSFVGPAVTKPPTMADIPAALAFYPTLTPEEKQIITDALTGYLSAPLP